jgi:hypothetical protein
MFGDAPSAAAPTPPPLPEATPPAPSFASGVGKLQPKGKPYGGTLLTSPIAPAPAAQTARKSLLGQ